MNTESKTRPANRENAETSEHSPGVSSSIPARSATLETRDRFADSSVLRTPVVDLRGASRAAASRVESSLGKLLKPRFLKVAEGFQYGWLQLVWPDGGVSEHGSQLASQQAHPVVVQLHNYDPILRMVRQGSIGFAESYIEGHWSTNDIYGLFQLYLTNQHRFPTTVQGSLFTRALNVFLHRRNRNTLSGSRRNIAHHYDLGNEFYRLWLDDSMSYSSALYQSDQETLEAAQQNKINRVVSMLNPQPGSRVLEIGCGWGSLATEIARQCGCSVLGISLSSEQLAYASREQSGEGLDTRFHFQDYRDVDGHFDHVVSIEMFEAVGHEYWDDYFERLSQVLRPGGTAALQIITIQEERYDDYRATPDFIQKYIFPGGMLPTRSHLNQLTEQFGFEQTDAHWFGASYAATLAEWRSRFERARESVMALGFDERFIRMWRYYLAYCEAGFACGRTDVGLIRLQKT